MMLTRRCTNVVLAGSRYLSGKPKKGGSNPYGDTIHLPKTDFPMRAGAKTREPMLQERCTNQLYKFQLAQTSSKKDWVLHDGPPYANGNLHMGHAMNKILKDIVNRYKLLSGHRVVFIPGWDCHGLPIELKALEAVEKSKSEHMEPMKIRGRAKRHAEKVIKSQKADFMRWGVMADWGNPYITMDKEYEARQIGLFGDMVKKGYIFRGERPVYWSPSSRTALAEAELEYNEKHKSRSILVRFPVLGWDNVSAVIWTTTPWTIPANMAVCANEEINYAIAEVDGLGEKLLVAENRLPFLEDELGSSATVLDRLSGAELQGIRMMLSHPLESSRSVPMIFGDHVTDDSGTGLVHTAPAHGLEDFEACSSLGIEVKSLVGPDGRFNDQAGQFSGLEVLSEGNSKVIEALQENKTLLAVNDYVHKYPYDWRTKKPVIFRATAQWFARLDKLYPDAHRCLDDVGLVPASGKARLRSMLQGRSNWCISRQRVWGVPIPVLYEATTGEPLLTEKSIEYIQSLVREHGTDCWWKLSAEELLAPEYRDDGKTYEKGSDTMDVWFDSGSSWNSVLHGRGLDTPADLYLEGSDQHRGWFQSSLLTSVAVKGSAPYKQVVTHGFVLDEAGRKMSKSLGNIVEPSSIVDGGKDQKKHPPYGADVLRLWVASTDFTKDVAIGNQVLVRVAESARKFRNTSKYMLGNLHDFDPAVSTIEHNDLLEIDRYVLHLLHSFGENITQAYGTYNFAKVYQELVNFMTVDLSSFYFDVVKDRLYTDPRDSIRRRAAQSVLHQALRTTTVALAPVMCHLGEDVHMHSRKGLWDANDDGGFESIFKEGWVPQELPSEWKDPQLAEKWTNLRALRSLVNKQLEIARTSSDIGIGSTLEAHVEIKMKTAEQISSLEMSEGDLSDLFIVSSVNVVLDSSVEDVRVGVSKATGGKCGRCWKYHASEDGALCKRCSDAILADQAIALS